jgi:peptide/nickel transport system substrate-binding protein
LVDFLANDAFSPIIAEHVVSQLPIEGLETTAFGTGEDPAFVVGTGPFRLQEYVVDDHVTLARFDDYWDGAPILDEIVTRMLADSQSAVSQLQTGAVDVAFLDPNSINQFEGTDVEVIEYLTTGIRFLALNQDTEQTTLFVDAPVRHALLHAIDRQALVDSVLLGYGEVQNSYLPSWIWANPPELIEVEYPYDPELAGQLLDEAGWLMGPDGIRERDGQKFQFTLWGNAGDPVQEATNAVIQEQWRQIGVACELQVETEDALYERYVEVKNYEAAFWRVFNTTPDLTWLFATDSYPDSGNRFKYSNPEADALMEQALSEPDPEARTALTAQIQNIILADLPILPLYANYPLQGVSQRVHNYHPSEINDYFNAETWWIEQ